MKSDRGGDNMGSIIYVNKEMKLAKEYMGEVRGEVLD